MARPYSDDLRSRILKAYERGGVSLGELAERFQVSLPYIKKIRRQLLRTGRMREWVWGSPDLTLVELQQKVRQNCRVQTSLSGIWWALQETGLRLKKNRSTPRSKIRPQPGSVGRRGGSR